MNYVADTSDLVTGQFIHHHQIAGPQCRDQVLFYPSLKQRAIDRAINIADVLSTERSVLTAVRLQLGTGDSLNLLNTRCESLGKLGGALTLPKRTGINRYYGRIRIQKIYDWALLVSHLTISHRIFHEVVVDE
jgi:hypothetical protein